MVNEEEFQELDEFEDQEGEELMEMFQDSVKDLAEELEIEVDEILGTLGEELVESISLFDPADVTDYYTEIEEQIFDHLLTSEDTGVQLDDADLNELRKYLVICRENIKMDRTYQMQIQGMINKAKMTLNNPIEIIGLTGGSTSGVPSIEELQRISAKFHQNEMPKVNISGAMPLTATGDGDEIFQSLINKHFGK